MKVEGYIQLEVSERSFAGLPKALRMARVTQRYPRDPLPGAIVIKTVFEVPDELLRLQAQVFVAVEDATIAAYTEPEVAVEEV